MLDTNVLLDWLLDRDAARTKRIDALLSSAKELHIPDIVIVELAFALEKFYEFLGFLSIFRTYLVLKIFEDPIERNLDLYI